MIPPPDVLLDLPAMASDSALLNTLRLSGGVFLDAAFHAPWCADSCIGPEDCRPFGLVPEHVIGFHLITAGTLQVRLSNPDQPEHALTAAAGDLILVPRNDPHLIGNDLAGVPLQLRSMLQPAPIPGISRVSYAGSGPASGVVCGFLGCERSTASLLGRLPPLMRIPVGQDAPRRWFESSFAFAAEYVSRDGDSTALVRLAEALLTEALRGYMRTNATELLLDERVSRAIGLLQSGLAQPWTIDTLAREVGLSRSAFATRFVRVMGISPMRFLTAQRLKHAAGLLEHTESPIARVAEASGYDSEAAFNRAFKKQFGAPPAAWRRQSRPTPP